VDGMHASAFALLSPIGYNTNLVKSEDARMKAGVRYANALIRTKA
jgi:hypothetical protein